MVADLNKTSLPVNSYDLVVAQTSLHHLLELEFVMDNVGRALKPGGFFWVADFVGESQFQWLDKRLRVANELLESLPAQLRWDQIDQRYLEPIVRRRPGSLASPFESIRSDEIPRLLRERFVVIAEREVDAFLSLVCPPGTFPAYAASEAGRRRFEELWQLDRQLVREGELPPAAGQYLLRP